MVYDELKFSKDFVQEKLSIINDILGNAVYDGACDFCSCVEQLGASDLARKIDYCSCAEMLLLDKIRELQEQTKELSARIGEYCDMIIERRTSDNRSSRSPLHDPVPDR